jgi:hypothetical protein
VALLGTVPCAAVTVPSIHSLELHSLELSKTMLHNLGPYMMTELYANLYNAKIQGRGEANGMALKSTVEQNIEIWSNHTHMHP